MQTKTTFAFLGVEIEGPARLVFAAVLLTVVGGVVGAATTWLHAPAVGSDLWPYIRALVSLFGGVVGAWIGAVTCLITVWIRILTE